MSKPDAGAPVARKGANPAAADPARAESVQSVVNLKEKLNGLSSVRPEKVEHARALLSTTSYPPAELLDRIATLLAVKLKH